MKSIGAAPRVTGPGEGECWEVVGLTCRPRVRGSDTGGVFTLIEIAAPPGSGSPTHICRLEDKAFYVLEGTFSILAGDRTVSAAPGTCVSVPRGMVHHFRNEGSGDGRLLVFLAPSGHEKFFEELSRVPAGAPPETSLALLHRFGVEIVPEEKGG